MIERDKAITQTLTDLVASFLAMRQRGLNVRLVLPATLKLQGSADKATWYDVGENYHLLDTMPYARMVQQLETPGNANITVQLVEQEQS